MSEKGFTGLKFLSDSNVSEKLPLTKKLLLQTESYLILSTALNCSVQSLLLIIKYEPLYVYDFELSNLEELSGNTEHRGWCPTPRPFQNI